LGFTVSINTAFAERINLTLRQGLAAVTPRSWAIAQLAPELEAHLAWWRTFFAISVAPIKACGLSWKHPKPTRANRHRASINRAPQQWPPV
jgi:hypothetical protein